MPRFFTVETFRFIEGVQAPSRRFEVLSGKNGITSKPYEDDFNSNFRVDISMLRNANLWGEGIIA